MGIVMRAASDGTPVKLQDLPAMLSHAPSYDATRVSIRFLENHGVLKRVRDKGLTYLHPTPSSYEWFRMNYR